MQHKWDIILTQIDDYFVVEVYETESGNLRMRIGFDHRPTNEEIDYVVQMLDEHPEQTGGEEV